MTTTTIDRAPEYTAAARAAAERAKGHARAAEDRAYQSQSSPLTSRSDYHHLLAVADSAWSFASNAEECAREAERGLRDAPSPEREQWAKRDAAAAQRNAIDAAMRVGRAAVTAEQSLCTLA